MKADRTWMRCGVSVVALLLLARVVLAAVGGAAAGRSSIRPEQILAAGARVHEDLWIALGFAALGAALALATRSTPRACGWANRGLWIAYGLTAAFVAVNVPIAAVLGSPVTFPMLAGAGGALVDSVRVYVTPANLAALAIVLAGAVLIPRRVADPILARRPVWIGLGMAAGIALLIGSIASSIVAPAAAASQQSRNAVLVLAETAWRQWTGAAPAVAAGEMPAAGIAAEGDAVDLRHLAGRAAGRNVVWIVLESTGASYLKPYGAVDDPMPNLTRLARGGLVFDHAYAVYPESIKGLFSLICSAAPAAYTDAGQYAAGRRPCQDLPGRLSAAGYQTALFHSGRFVYLGMQAVIEDRGYDLTADAGSIGGPFASSFGVDEASTVEHILDFIDRRDPDRPFFVHYLPIAGHHPYESPGNGPRPFGESDEFHRYLSDLAAGDHAIGTLIAGLGARGLTDNTLWIISGDHGEAFYQHEGNFAHSLHLYEENVRVPLVIAGAGLAGSFDPDRTDRRQVVRHVPQIASTIDIAPTLLDVLGIAIPAGYQGRTLLSPKPGLARFYTDHTVWRFGLRQGRWKYIAEVESGSGQLFDLASDPGERRDVAAAQPDRAARYRAELVRWAAEAR